jgi:uncharacterized protein involved in type VI secretion and phage assembly
MNKIEGVVIAIVRDVEDPLKLGRIRVHFPWMDDDHITDWIRIATMYGGDSKGSFFIPDPGDEVLVAFEHGSGRVPIMIGAMWNGKGQPPTEPVRERRLQSRNGHKIRMLDSTPVSGNKGALVVEDAHGNRITMTNGKIRIESVALLEIAAPAISLTGPGYRRMVLPNNNPI